VFSNTDSQQQAEAHMKVFRGAIVLGVASRWSAEAQRGLSWAVWGTR